MQEYTAPEAVKTKLRCQFGLPGKKYDCRRIGKYCLNGKRYCAPHYDTAWKVANPEYGQQHDWHIQNNTITGEPWPYETCRRCGAIRPHEWLPVSACNGKMPEIRLRAAGLKSDLHPAV